MGLTVNTIELLSTKGWVIVLGLVDGTWRELVRRKAWTVEDMPQDQALLEFSRRRDLTPNHGPAVEGAGVRCNQACFVGARLARCLHLERHLGLCTFPEAED